MVSVESELIEIAERLARLGVTRIERNSKGEWVFYYRAADGAEQSIICENDPRRFRGFGPARG